MPHTLPKLALTFLALGALSALAPAQEKKEKSGEVIYRQMCARCHGAKGEGAKAYPIPLVGDKSLSQLAKVIDDTMPDGAPELLDAAESRRVAEYMYGAFYSPTAQAKLHPPRVELSRLTVKQYRNSVADALAAFRPAAPKPDDKQGLRGEYFNSRNFQNNKRQIDRLDPGVDFDFGKEAPKAEPAPKEAFDAHTFCIRWEGSVWAPETGVYEFVVKTDHALRLWINNNKQPAIDAWVKSGDGTEFKTTAYLLAGRAYPVRLEFSKAKQGVDDSKKNPNPPVKPAFVSLNWKRPNRGVEPIAARYLTPQKFPEVAVIESPFPPDDRSLGWERGTTVSKEWEAATTEGAIETAAYVLARLPELSGAQPTAPDRAVKLKAFCRTLTERAFRRPLSEPEKALLIDRQFEAAGSDLELAVKRVVLIALKSPRFLYIDAASTSEQYATASRLAFSLWDAPPDKELLDAAARNKLGTPAELRQQAERMLADPRAKVKMREFLLTWLKLDQVKELPKDAKRFPGFDHDLAADLRTSLELSLDDVLSSPNADFRQLLLADDIYLNGKLAKFYGANVPADSGFKKVRYEPDKRAGVLTHPYVLAALAYASETSPIHRGVFVGRGLLGIAIRPPMEAFTPLAPDLHPTLTTRERVLKQTSPAACAGCHTVMNPLGFSLEQFDAVGKFREEDNNKPVDASGLYETRAGATQKFTGAQQLAKFLAGSEEAHYAFAQQAFHFFVKQPVRAYGLAKPEELRKTFAESGLNVRKLVVEIAVIGAMPKKDEKPPK